MCPQRARTRGTGRETQQLQRSHTHAGVTGSGVRRLRTFRSGLGRIIQKPGAQMRGCRTAKIPRDPMSSFNPLLTLVTRDAWAAKLSAVSRSAVLQLESRTHLKSDLARWTNARISKSHLIDQSAPTRRAIAPIQQVSTEKRDGPKLIGFEVLNPAAE